MEQISGPEASAAGKKCASDANESSRASLQRGGGGGVLAALQRRCRLREAGTDGGSSGSRAVSSSKTTLFITGAQTA